MKSLFSKIRLFLGRLKKASVHFKTVWASTELKLLWLQMTRRSQWILAGALLLGLFILPPVFEAAGDAVFPPKRRGFFRRSIKRQAGAERITIVLNTLFWISTVGTSVSLAWLELPRVVRRSRELDQTATGRALQVTEGTISPKAPSLTVPHSAAPLSQAPSRQAISSEEAFAPTIITSSLQPNSNEDPPTEPLPKTNAHPELDETLLAATTEQQDRYVIEGELGRGGMGIVYGARDTVLDRKVALKALPPEYMSGETTASRFRQEARMLARLTHPNIVQVYDFIEADGGLYIAMELVPGKNLADHIEESGPLDLIPATELGVQLAEAMAYAHSQGVLHRDFKPHNVLLTEDMVPKITDFGLATAAEAPHLTQTGAVMGSPAYMSPEQATGETLGPTSDIYSFGATLFHILSGRPPYTGNIMQIVLQQASNPPPSIREIVPDIPEKLDELITKLLAKKTNERIQEMKDVAEKLRDFQRPPDSQKGQVLSARQ